jgi:hypothetical protein
VHFWLELATELPMHELERQVVAKVGPKTLVQDQPAEAHWRTPETVELRMHLPAATWALVKRAMQGARQAAEQSLSDAEALEAVALEALSRLCGERSWPGTEDGAVCAASTATWTCITSRHEAPGARIHAPIARSFALAATPRCTKASCDCKETQRASCDWSAPLGALAASRTTLLTSRAARNRAPSRPSSARVPTGRTHREPPPAAYEHAPVGGSG